MSLRLLPSASPTDPPIAATLFAAAPSHDIGDLLVFAHGAGAGQASPFMRSYAEALAARGITVVTFDFRYVTAGRKAPDRAPVLEQTFRDAVRGAVAQAGADTGAPYRRVFIGGKSMGGRMATHLAAAPDAWPAGAPPLSGAIALGYPLTPPHRRASPARSGSVPASSARAGGDRVSHLHRLASPLLVVQGTRDAFGGPEEVRAAVFDGSASPPVTIVPVPGGDHSFAVLKSSGLEQDTVHTGIHDAIVRWMQDVPVR